MNNKQTLIKYLNVLGLSADECKIYLELIKDQHSHLELARLTGINRTKVYRLAETLQKRSLITTQTDDRGTFLIATDPSTLEVELTTKEENLKNQRTAFTHLLPELNKIQKQGKYIPGFFEVNTYEGVEGMKQMLWHELKTKGEALIFGFGTIESLVESKSWAERHRTLTMSAGYTIREILNPGTKPDDFTKIADFQEVFTKKILPKGVLLLEHQTVIYNNTVSVYSWQNDQKVGYEVVNESYAKMWRQIFENYWSQ